MIKVFNVDLASFGFLRLSLFSLAIMTTLFCIIVPLFSPEIVGAELDSFWPIFVTLIAPVLSVLFIIVVFLDYVMSKVRASDVEDESHHKFIAIYRLELLIIFFMLAYWVPFFVTLG